MATPLAAMYGSSNLMVYYMFNLLFCLNFAIPVCFCAALQGSAMDKMMADMMSKMFSKAILMEPIKAITAKVFFVACSPLRHRNDDSDWRII